MNHKVTKTCSSCETKYTVSWDIDEQDLEPMTCPFCGHEIEHEDEQEAVWSNEDEDDNWN